MSNYSELFFLGRSQTSSGIELEENYISVFNDVISTLLSVLACRLERRERRRKGEGGEEREKEKKGQEGRKARREGGMEGVKPISMTIHISVISC